MIRASTVLGLVFSLPGIVFFIVQAILKVMVSSRNKLHNELLVNGTKIKGKTYHHKSRLLWDQPDFMEHDSIVVYTNNSGKSTIPL